MHHLEDGIADRGLEKGVVDVRHGRDCSEALAVLAHEEMLRRAQSAVLSAFYLKSQREDFSRLLFSIARAATKFFTIREHVHGPAGLERDSAGN